eukprot:Hpha_TRINITY_DN15042_c3_g6::TRINITY_DN15042_c3_g6_i2::g.125747::m.125747
MTPDTPSRENPAGAVLRDFVAGLNRRQDSRLWQWLWSWPHFPGEDLVPDFSPFLGADLPTYGLAAGRIATLEIYRVKTFYSGSDFLFLDSSLVGTVQAAPSAKGADEDDEGEPYTAPLCAESFRVGSRGNIGDDD